VWILLTNIRWKDPRIKTQFKEALKWRILLKNTKWKDSSLGKWKKEEEKVQDGRTQVLANEGHSKEGGGPLRGGEQIKRRFGYGGNGDI
jgi:hypothetical protein